MILGTLIKLSRPTSMKVGRLPLILLLGLMVGGSGLIKKESLLGKMNYRL